MIFDIEKITKPNFKKVVVIMGKKSTFDNLSTLTASNETFMLYFL